MALRAGGGGGARGAGPTRPQGMVREGRPTRDPPREPPTPQPQPARTHRPGAPSAGWPGVWGQRPRSTNPHQDPHPSGGFRTRFTGAGNTRPRLTTGNGAGQKSTSPTPLLSVRRQIRPALWLDSAGAQVQSLIGQQRDEVPLRLERDRGGLAAVPASLERGRLRPVSHSALDSHRTWLREHPVPPGVTPDTEPSGPVCLLQPRAVRTGPRCARKRLSHGAARSAGRAEVHSRPYNEHPVRRTPNLEPERPRRPEKRRLPTTRSPAGPPHADRVSPVGPLPAFSSSSLQADLQVQRELAVDETYSAAMLASLARQIVSDPSMAGEQWHVVAPPRLLELPPLGWDGNNLLKNDLLLLRHLGGGKSITLALHAEREWRRRHQLVQSRNDLLAAIRTAYASAHAYAENEWIRAIKRRASLPSTIPSSLPSLTAPLRATARAVVELLQSLLPAVATLPMLQADMAYWRRTAEELWRLQSTSVDRPPEPGDAVVLESSPCGIRRLTAVRVPRAPGSVRTSPIPDSSSLAAA